MTDRMFADLGDPKSTSKYVVFDYDLWNRLEKIAEDLSGYDGDAEHVINHFLRRALGMEYLAFPGMRTKQKAQLDSYWIGEYVGTEQVISDDREDIKPPTITEALELYPSATNEEIAKLTYKKPDTVRKIRAKSKNPANAKNASNPDSTVLGCPESGQPMKNEMIEIVDGEIEESIDDLISFVNKEHEEIVTLVQTGLNKAKYLGSKLIRIKELVEYGEWGRLFETKRISFSRSSADTYIKIAEIPDQLFLDRDPKTILEALSISAQIRQEQKQLEPKICCPGCNSTKITKSGKNYNKQVYRCTQCGKTFKLTLQNQSLIEAVGN